jgi:hypothetical protein
LRKILRKLLEHYCQLAEHRYVSRSISYGCGKPVVSGPLPEMNRGDSPWWAFELHAALLFSWLTNAFLVRRRISGPECSGFSQRA